MRPRAKRNSRTGVPRLRYARQEVGKNDLEMGVNGERLRVRFASECGSRTAPTFSPCERAVGTSSHLASGVEPSQVCRFGALPEDHPRSDDSALPPPYSRRGALAFARLLARLTGRPGVGRCRRPKPEAFFAAVDDVSAGRGEIRRGSCGVRVPFARPGWRMRRRRPVAGFRPSRIFE